MRRRPASITAITGAAALATALFGGGAASADVVHLPGPKASPYVAMGDSYAAGAAIAPLDPAADPRCSQSTSNYAHVIARRTLAKDFTDVSCSGADTSDYTSAQFPGVAPQLDALDHKTRLVTMMIGGNDSDVFGNAIAACATAAFTDPTGNPCERKHGDQFVNLVQQQTYPSLLRTLKQVRHAAPQARVAILGYPRILPTKGSAACTGTMLVAQGDVPYLNTLQKTLNDRVRRAAQKNGVKYVDMWDASAGHDACQAPGTRWVEPIAPINAAPVHPNARGEVAMADQTVKTLRLRTR